MKPINVMVACAAALVLISCGNTKPETRFVEDKAMCMDMSAPPLNAEVNTESYNQIVENDYASVNANPLSTFAIDVDGASYANVRRMLHEGTLPPADAVRIEEFINYFPYSYPKPKDGQTFSIYTEYAKCPWNKEHNLLQVAIKGKEIESEKTPPSNLVFLIDASGSMQNANKLPLLKKAFGLLLKQLNEDDKVSVVVYAGASGLILDGVHGDKKEEITEALEKLEAGGSTAGGEGINLAYKVAEEHFKKSGNNRVILATDGDFNVGVSTQLGLRELIKEKREKGIYLSVLGFGEGNIKDNNMEALADEGNGNYNYIDNFNEARKVLVSQMSGTLYTIAKDVKVQVEFNPAQVKEYRLIGYENRLLKAEDFNNDKKDAGELGAGHCVTALYEIIPTESKEKMTSVDNLKYTKASSINSSDEIVNIKFRYKGAKKDDTTSVLISQSVISKPELEDSYSDNLRLAAGASQFGMLLRDSKYKGQANFDNAIQLVSGMKETDKENYAGGLIEMISMAKELSKTPVSKQ